jgi:phosphoinositide-3-kinase regulatory subunit 4
MGQGFSLTTLSAGSAGIDVPELADLQYERALGTARFMKTIRCRHKDGVVVAKVVMKPYADFTLDRYVTRLIRKLSKYLPAQVKVDTCVEERKLLEDVPNALAYQRIIETSTSGCLVRQYIHSNLYDRLR